jgi:peptidoglycan hydrolase FlgJ
MSVGAVNPSLYADPAALGALKRDAAAQTPEALRATARQFESLFTSLLLKSMRESLPGDPFGSDQQDFYQDMFDQQLASQLSNGKGLGLADVLVRQLMQGAGAPPDPAAGLTAQGTSGPGAGQWPARNAEEFVRTIRPAATAAARELGVDADTIIAHAALETGWGRSMPTGADGRPSFNLFGIKAGSSWTGAVQQSQTKEFSGGRMHEVTDGFRAYSSPEQSIQDYVGLLKGNPRYAGALGTGSDAEAFARGLARGGYATDPDYVTKLTAVAARLKLAAGGPITQART